MRDRNDPVLRRHQAQEGRIDLRRESERVEAVPQQQRHRKKGIVPLRYFDDAVVGRHEYYAAQGAMRPEVNGDAAPQASPHRDDAPGIHVRTLLGVVVNREPVPEEFPLAGLALAFAVAAKVHEQQRPAGELVRDLGEPGNFLRVAAEVDDKGRGDGGPFHEPAAQLYAVRGDEGQLLDIGARGRAGVDRPRKEHQPLLEEPREQQHADRDRERDLDERGDHQCSLTRGSVPRFSNRASVSSATPKGPYSAYRCILYKDRYISRANQPSTR